MKEMGAVMIFLHATYREVGTMEYLLIMYGDSFVVLS
jgi:hypothetical protein